MWEISETKSIFQEKKKEEQESKLCWRNLIKEIITWTVVLVRYSGRFLKQMRLELRQMNQRTKTLRIMPNVLDVRDVRDEVYVSRQEEDSLAFVEMTIQGFPVSWGVEYTDCISVEGQDFPDEWIWYLTIWWWNFSNAWALGNVDYPYIASVPRSTLTCSGRTW